MSSNFYPRHYNIDGSRNIYCKQCMRLVGSTASGQAGFGSCICAICDSANNGVDLSPEIQDALTNNVRMQSGFMVPRSAILPTAEDMPDDPILGKEKKEGFG